jgi:hypothetical protein
MSIKTNPFAKILFGTTTDEEKVQAIVQLVTYDIKKTPDQNQKHINDFNDLMENLKQERHQITGGIFQALQGLGQAEKEAEADQPKKGSVRNVLDAIKADGVGGYLSGIGKNLDELTETNNKIRHHYDLLEAAAREATRQSQEQRDTLIASMDSHIAATTAGAKEAQSTSDHLKEVASRLKTTLTDKNQYAKAGKAVTSAAGTVTKKATAVAARGALKAAWFLTKTAGSAAVNGAFDTKKKRKGPGAG